MSAFAGFVGSFPGAGGGQPAGPGAPAVPPALASPDTEAGRFPITPGLTGLMGAAPRGLAATALALPIAPAAPAAANVIATTARGSGAGWGGAVGEVPETLGEVLHYFDPPPGFAEFLTNLDAEDDTPTDVFLSAPEADYVDALDRTEVDGTRLSAMRKGRLIVALRSIFAACGKVAPAFGTAAAASPPPPAAPPQALAVLGPPAPASEQPYLVVSLAQTVDQALKGSAPRLDPASLAACRAHFERVTGAPPPERHLPTVDQLSGLRAVLASGLAPYVDFAVWSALGPRLAKFQKTEAAVLVGGAFVTKVLDAPNTIAAWEDSWAIFATAMVSLNAARPGSLSTYADGIKSLMRHFPSRWATIVATDLIVRSERWARLREDLARGPLPVDFDSSAPWDWVIAASAYGRAGPLSLWWQEEVVMPLTLGHASAFAGLAGGGGSSTERRASSSTAPPAKRQRGNRGTGGGSGRGSSAGGGAGSADVSQQICHSWNWGHGTCAGDGPCPAGRRHVCLTCPPHPGVAHRACHAHPKERKGRGKGKNKGKDKGTPASGSQS